MIFLFKKGFSLQEIAAVFRDYKKYIHIRVLRRK
jgi:hypothetical protein